MKEIMASSLVSSSYLNGSFLVPSIRPQILTQRTLSQHFSHSRVKPNKAPNFCPKATTLRRNLEATRVPISVPVRVAHELLQAGHRYLDVRTPEEFSAGHAPGAVNIPYMYRVGSGMTRNPHFVAEVSSHFRKQDEIIVGCQSGKRSMMAATDLLASGYTYITDIAGGFATWSHNSLPME
ncbi:thiosulfate sulfurtransferase 16, chloroplastic isoform X2 [Cannabis sativa]|uniref:thiosulfate sulfurtransferase 16, chloroplastic isoform X2 n=1 Tax=Cannabis sativa TaxID=3483 RepID=UPI0029CA5107|nr:thiosulfate sulfurtransferase 16, chloroplastic isoform X2 [Cannabis sativa]